jgi:arylsulfatase A-like enzyme
MTVPNIVLLTVDTLRTDMVGCYGSNGQFTPNIDRLAANGIRFQWAATGGSWTQAAFPPILTSTYASMYGGCLGPLAEARPSPVEILATNGYRTAAFSTSPLLSRRYGYQRGFDTFQELYPAEPEPWLRRVKGGQKLLRSPRFHRFAAMFGQQLRPARLYSSGEVLNDSVCGWLAGVDDPFFAWVHYMDVHWPYHRADHLNGPASIAQMWRDLGHMHGANWDGVPITDEQRAHYLQLYCAAVQYVDQQIGDLLERLDQMNRLDNTVILLVSDHGEEFLERRHWGHFETNLYDEILRVPLLISGANIPAGTVVDQQVSTIDIMPTMLELCHCPFPAGMEGQSMIPLWQPERGSYERELAIGEMWRDHRHIVAVRTVEFKYIWDSFFPDKPKLFDLSTDPNELEDLSGRLPQQARYFQDVVDGHLKRVADQNVQAAEEPEADPELLRRLRDLGYVE